jgi:undecaprenyl-diphosphatase
VAAGAHFPADVVGGALVGLLSSWLASRLLALAGYGARG